jgi:hypothetical protein
MVPAEETTKASEDKQGLSVPAITLPKGGGAIHGMGEKFAANPVTGTGSMSIPIATSSGRSGFGPQLSLSYVLLDIVCSGLYIVSVPDGALWKL